VYKRQLFASFAVLIPWLGFEVRAYMIVVGRYEASMVTTEPMGYLIGCCLMGAFALVVSLASFHYYRGLRRFSRDRRVVVLHAAMRRLRMLWRFLGIFLFLLVLLALLPMLNGSAGPAK
jgi:hypothetical protein